MQTAARYILAVALLFAGSSAFASNAAPNVQVTVKQGRTTLFKGITDGSGKFTTLPMEPGVYTFELRALKTAPPAQYFLLLSGAKPVTAPMADKKVVLTMDAQVRRPRSVIGQVTARRLRILAPQTASAEPNATPVPIAPTTAAPQRATASDVVTRTVAAPSPAAARPATRTRIINGKPHVWVPIAPGSTVGRWVPGQP